MGGDGASLNEIGFDGVPNGFMCEHSRKLSSENDGLHSRFGVNALALLHEALVQKIDFAVKRVGRREIVVEGSESADRTEQLNGSSVGAFRTHEKVDVAPVDRSVSVGTVGRCEKLFHGVLADGYAASGQILTFFLYI